MFQVPCHVKTCSKTASLLRMNGMPWWRDARHGNRADRPLPRETKSRQGTYQNISFGTQYFLLDLMRGCFGHLLMGSHFYKIRISVREKKKLSLLQRKNVWKHQTVKKYRFVLWTLFANIWNGQLRASWMNECRMRQMKSETGGQRSRFDTATKAYSTSLVYYKDDIPSMPAPPPTNQVWSVQLTPYHSSNCQ